MGILDSGPLGPFRKKMGPGIGRRHMGQDLILPLYHKTTRKATPGQLSERDKFSMLNKFLVLMQTAINPGFKEYAKKQSAVNAAASYNYDHAFIEADGQTELNYPKLVFSRGQISAPNGLRAMPGINFINFSWQPQPQSLYCQNTDKASFLIYHPRKNTAIIRPNVVDRYELGFTLEVPFSGEAVHCYIIFASADGKLVGDSKYAGMVTLQF